MLGNCRPLKIETSKSMSMSSVRDRSNIRKLWSPSPRRLVSGSSSTDRTISSPSASIWKTRTSVRRFRIKIRRYVWLLRPSQLIKLRKRSLMPPSSSLEETWICSVSCSPSSSLLALRLNLRFRPSR